MRRQDFPTGVFFILFSRIFPASVSPLRTPPFSLWLSHSKCKNHPSPWSQPSSGQNVSCTPGGYRPDLGRFQESWQRTKEEAGKIKSPQLPQCGGPLGAVSSNRSEGDFTHPQVGQAERLACRKRPPNAFLRAEARTHFFCPAGPIDNFLIILPV